MDREVLWINYKSAKKHLRNITRLNHIWGIWKLNAHISYRYKSYFCIVLKQNSIDTGLDFINYIRCNILC